MPLTVLNLTALPGLVVGVGLAVAVRFRAPEIQMAGRPVLADFTEEAGLAAEEQDSLLALILGVLLGLARAVRKVFWPFRSSARPAAASFISLGETCHPFRTSTTRF